MSIKIMSRVWERGPVTRLVSILAVVRPERFDIRRDMA
jgi:hypothetical protein